MEQIIQTDIDNLADIIWWIKGIQAGEKEACELSPFNDEHVESLRKIRLNWKEEDTDKSLPKDSIEIDEQLIEELSHESPLCNWGFLARIARMKTWLIRVRTGSESRVGYCVGVGSHDGMYSVLKPDDGGENVRVYYKDITAIEFLGC